MITFTDAATNKVRSILEEEGNLDLHLRIFVQGGGCSGFQYGFALEEMINEDDFEFEANGIRFLVDSVSMQYLKGAVVDFIDELTGSSFTIRNPNSSGQCGCGSSFSI